MRLVVSPSNPLRGSVDIPGDLRIALSALSFGMLVPGPLTLANVPQSSLVDRFLGFLSDHGAAFTSEGGKVAFRGSPWPEHVRINDDVPDEILHQIIGATVFSAKSVIIEHGAGKRTLIAAPALASLTPVGLDSSDVEYDGDDIVIDGAGFSPPGIVEAFSGPSVEMILCASQAASIPVTLAFPPQLAAQSMKLAKLLGCHVKSGTATDDPNGRNRELTRRLARARGIRAVETCTCEWHPDAVESLTLPGDSLIAAAICGAAALIQRSRVTVRRVIWEQDRRGFFEILKRMKGTVSWSPAGKTELFDTANVTVEWHPLEGIHVTAEQALAMRDELPILAAVASYASGTTVIREDGTIPSKGRETFRILARGLVEMGVHVGDFTDGIVLDGRTELNGTAVNVADNPAAALALAVTALGASGETGIDDVPDEYSSIPELMKIVGTIASPAVPGR